MRTQTVTKRPDLSADQTGMGQGHYNDDGYSRITHFPRLVYRHRAAAVRGHDSLAHRSYHSGDDRRARTYSQMPWLVTQFYSFK